VNGEWVAGPPAGIRFPAGGFRRRATRFLLFALAGVVACGGSEARNPPGAPDPSFAAPDPLPPRPLGLDLYLPTPDHNRLTAEKAALGRRLFFDPALSRDRSVACASCHRPERAFGDSLRVSRGVEGRTGTRNAPPLVNRAWEKSFFWDGRVDSLKEQALHPIQSPEEMDLPLDRLIRRLNRDPTYREAFRRAFPQEAEAVTPSGVARALASFVRTLQAGDAPFDRFRAGEVDAIPADARRGAQLFFGRARCTLCHAGPTFADGRFHNTGVSWGSGDPGRYRVTGRSQDRGRFRTPTLRQLVHTAPYMHDGSLATLAEVVEHYDKGGTPDPFLSPEIRPLGLSEREKADLAAFLRTLSGTLHPAGPRR
jgi:cytochrome c peroxidase